MADERDRALAQLAVESGFLTQEEAGGYWQRVQAPGSPRLAQLLMQEGRLSQADMATLRQRFLEAQGPSGAQPRLGSPRPGSGRNPGPLPAPPAAAYAPPGEDPNWAKSLEKDGLLARVLLNRGLTTQDRLRECRQIQIQQQQRLGVILVQKGYVGRGAVEEAIALVRERMGHEPTFEISPPLVGGTGGFAPLAPAPPGTGSFGPAPGTGTFGPPPGTGNFGPDPGTGTFGPPPGTGHFGPPPGTGNFGPAPGTGNFGPPPGTGNFGPPPSSGGLVGIDGGAPSPSDNPFASVRAAPSPLAATDEPPTFGAVSIEELNPFAGGGEVGEPPPAPSPPNPNLELSMDELNPFHAGGNAAPAPAADVPAAGSDFPAQGSDFGGSGPGSDFPTASFGEGGGFGEPPPSGAFGDAGGGAFGAPAAGFGEAGGGAFGEQPASGAFGAPAPGEPAFGEPAFGEPAFGEPAFGEPAFGEPAFGEPAFGAAGPAPAPAPAAFGGDPWSAPPAPSSGLTPAGVPVGGQADSLRNKGGSGSLARQEGKRNKRKKKKKGEQAETNTKALVIGIVIMVVVVLVLVAGVLAVADL